MEDEYTEEGVVQEGLGWLNNGGEQWRGTMEGTRSDNRGDPIGRYTDGGSGCLVDADLVFTVDITYHLAHGHGNRHHDTCGYSKSTVMSSLT